MAGKLLLAVALSLSALALSVAWLAARHEARAEASHPPQGQILDIGGHRVHALVMGSGPDLVLIHGASGNLRDMTFSLAPRLAERYRVIAIDRPGLGYTDRINRSGASIAQQAELLMQTARHLGAERPIVLGHSYGGAVALAWAAYYPEDLSALIAVSSPSMSWTTALDPLYRVTSSWLGGALAVPLITAFVPDSRVDEAVESIFAPQPVPEGYAAHVGTGLTLRRVSLRANADQRASLLDEIIALQPFYAQIAVPTELVHGSADTTVGLSIHSEKLVDRIPGAVLTRLPGIGHMPHHVAEDAVVAAIDRAAARAGLR